MRKSWRRLPERGQPPRGQGRLSRTRVRLTPLLISWVGCNGRNFRFYVLPANGINSCAWFGPRISGPPIPIYFRDIDFYLFVLPFLNLVQSSLVVLTLGGTLMLGSHTFGRAVFDSVPKIK